MKPLHNSTTWIAAAVLATTAIATQNTQAEDLGIDFLQDLNKIQRTTPGNEKRLPATERVRRGLNVNRLAHRNRAMSRRDEMTSNVMSLHFICSPGSKLRAGHGLAPNLHKIVRRKK